MEKDQQQMTLPSTSGLGRLVVNENAIAAPDAFIATSTIEGEGGAAASSKADKKKVFASEEQISAVFCNNLVSS